MKRFPSRQILCDNKRTTYGSTYQRKDCLARTISNYLGDLLEGTVTAILKSADVTAEEFLQA